MTLNLKELIKDYRAGEDSVFVLIYNEFYGLLRHYSKKIYDDEAFGLLTVFFIELINKININKFEESENIRRYIAVSIGNEYKRILAETIDRNSRSVELKDYDRPYYMSLDEQIDLKRALKTLTRKQRRIIIYRYVYGFSDAEISKRLRISRQAVCGIRKRGLLFLKQYLEFDDDKLVG